MVLRHAHASGLIGGYAVCGNQTGIVTENDETITCKKCLIIIVKQNYKPTKQQQYLIDYD